MSDEMSAAGWDILFDRHDPDDERRREALLALGNGALLTRAAATAAGRDDTSYPGTYRAGLYDRRDEMADDVHLGHDVLANLPDWLPLAVRARGAAAWLSPDTAEILSYRHGLSTARGVSCRDMELRGPGGRRVRLRERRLVSMARPRLAALRLEIEPVGWSGAFEIRSGLDGGVSNGNWPQELPGTRRLLAEPDGSQPAPGTLLLRTHLRQSGVAVAVAARTDVAGAAIADRRRVPAERGVAELIRCAADGSGVVVVEKIAALVTGRDLASFEPGEAALETLRDAPDFAALLAEHEAAWARLWERCRLHVGTPRIDRALRVHAFHLLQTASPHTIELDAGLPARGWQEAYAGQVFWDQTVAFPVLAFRLPAVARGLLLYRFRRLGAARRAAGAHGLRGALFPWRSATTGREETPARQPDPHTGEWRPDDTHLARHVSLAIARDIRSYVLATGDLDFLALYGGELLVDIARFWASLARPIGDGRYDFEGVTGPDEFHTGLPGRPPGLATNAYTNVFASSVLARAPELLDLLPPLRREALFRALALTPEEIAHWHTLSRGLSLVFHRDGVISQFRGYEALQPVDLAALARAHPGQPVDRALRAEGRRVAECQVVKQADLLMLPYLFPGPQWREALDRMGYRVDDATLARTARWYLDRTVHESSLSRIACAGAFAQCDPAMSWRLYDEALRLDLDPARGSGTSEGVHLGSMAATLDVLQRIYLGLDVEPQGLVLAPNIPPDLPPSEMCLFHRGSALELAWTGRALRVRSDPSNPAPTRIRHGDDRRVLRPGSGESFVL